MRGRGQSSRIGKSPRTRASVKPNQKKTTPFTGSSLVNGVISCPVEALDTSILFHPYGQSTILSSAFHPILNLITSVLFVFRRHWDRCVRDNGMYEFHSDAVFYDCLCLPAAALPVFCRLSGKSSANDRAPSCAFSEFPPLTGSICQLFIYFSPSGASFPCSLEVNSYLFGKFCFNLISL